MCCAGLLEGEDKLLLHPRSSAHAQLPHPNAAAPLGTTSPNRLTFCWQDALVAAGLQAQPEALNFTSPE
eukprot:7037997-Prymnesium_polylepis.1